MYDTTRVIIFANIAIILAESISRTVREGGYLRRGYRISYSLHYTMIKVDNCPVSERIEKLLLYISVSITLTVIQVKSFFIEVE